MQNFGMIKTNQIPIIAEKINSLIIRYAKRHKIEKFCKPIKYEILIPYKTIFHKVQFEISEINMQKVFDEHKKNHGIDSDFYVSLLCENKLPVDVFIKTHYLEYHFIKLITYTFTQNISGFSKENMKTLNGIWKHCDTRK
jgi:hypothetical protein